MIVYFGITHLVAYVEEGKMKKAEELVFQADAAYENQEYERALALYRESVDTKPLHDVHEKMERTRGIIASKQNFASAMTLFEKEEYDPAKELFERVISRDTENYRLAREKLSEIREWEETQLAEKREKYREQSESFRPQVEEMHAIISDHYSKLVAEYNMHRRSYDKTAWSVFLANWNRQLKTYRGELDRFGVNGHTMNLFYARNQISMAATNMAAVWLSYANLLDNKLVQESRDDLQYFDREIRSSLAEAEQALEDGD